MENGPTSCDINFQGFLIGHGGEVTSIVSGNSSPEAEDNILVSGSRDKTLIIWNLTPEQEDGETYGIPFKSLTGHNHFVSDLTISNDNGYVISSSWDKTMRLWDISHGRCLERFVGHTKEIHTVCFSADNRQILSGGSERNIRIWNTLGDCKVKSDHSNHKGWVSKVRFSETPKNAYYASVGRDGRLKIWNGIFKLHASIKAHDNYINALSLSKNSRFLATGGRDKEIKIWDYTNLTSAFRKYSLDSEIYDLAFHTNYEWIACAVDGQVVIYDISAKEESEPIAVANLELLPGADENAKKPRATSLCWSGNSSKLYVGCSDNVIRVYSIEVTRN